MVSIAQPMTCELRLDQQKAVFLTEQPNQNAIQQHSSTRFCIKMVEKSSIKSPDE